MARRQSSSLSFETFTTSLKDGKFSPLYLFTGEEEFLTEECLETLLDRAVDVSSRSFNLDVVYGGEVSAKDVVALASAFPMMAERRVVVVREAEKLVATEADREILMRYLKSPLSSTVLVLITMKADMRLSVFKVFQDKGVVVESNPLYDSDIPTWLERRVKKLGRSISPEACELLHAHVGNSLRELHNEMEKLFLYAGEKKTIGVEEVSAVVGMSRLYNVFELQRAIGEGDAPRSVEILERMLDAGENPVGIIAILTRFFQKLWILPSIRRRASSEYEVASKLQVKPYFVREYIAASRHFTGVQLAQVFDALLAADVALKTSQGEPRVIMTSLVYKMVRHEQIRLSAEG